MPRKSLKNRIYMDIAKSIATLGTCKRLKVGVVLLREDGSFAGAGYNGAPAGMEHCTDETCNENNRCLHTAHAEENALFNSEGKVYKAYVTHEPCLVCTRMMAKRGVRQVFYGKPYNSIAERERLERDKIIAHYGIEWTELNYEN